MPSSPIITFLASMAHFRKQAIMSENKTRIRIMLVDAHPAIRQSWKMLLEHNAHFDVIGDSENGEKAFELARRLNPDIMLIDLNMFPINGFALTELVSKNLPTIKVIGISVNNHPRYAQRMLELGARGYITKTSSMEEIVLGIGKVFAGEVFICDEIKKNMN